MSKNNNTLAITRTFTSIAVLTSICCMAVGSLLPAQAQPTMATSIVNFQADATNPSMLIQTKATEQRVALLLNEDFGQGSSFVLLKDHPQVHKPKGLPDIHVGYGQFFSAQNLVPSSTSRIEPPSRLYLKVSFAF
jgi:hypothetical protein